MNKISSVREMQGIADELRSKGKRIGLVPTMGYLHQGHLSLVDEAKRHSDVVIMSIYVNPTQFGRGEDFDKYPRDLARDEEMASQKSVNYLFVPSDKEMYRDEHLAYVEVEKVSSLLEGEFRPRHFKGVASVVAKLFNIVKPHAAVFGQKDAQQAFIIKKMVEDLNFDVQIIVAPIVREPDGLAMSSRNVYLSPSQREQATVLYKSLRLAEKLVAGGEKDLVRSRAEMVKMITDSSDGKIDYVSFVDPKNFTKIESAKDLDEVQALLAVRFGKTRLIDNMLLKTGKR